MIEITLTHYLVITTLLFAIGLIGILRRKNLLMLFFSTEILLNSVNIGFAAISQYYGDGDLTGQMFAFFIIAIAASEVAVGLGLLIIWYKRSGRIDLDIMKTMNG